LSNVFDSSFEKKLVKTALLFATLFFIIGFFLPGKATTGFLAGYSVGFVTVILHLSMSLFTHKSSLSKKFMKRYYYGFFVRLAVVSVLFVLILILTEIDELSFTVSFIISYILNSVIEVIFLNQKLSD